MLKRLELSGFKSFAERTVFDLSPGITAIVGPNGSGKSNIVDAIRWVLGEQSAKSLRGSGMADVLFNGTRTRKPLNLAEVALTFDNANRILPLDAPEIRIARRLFRDGTSEYEINGQSARLKDIRDLLLGSGAEAYSIIAQGQVDALLNANPDERRHVFEEAAGISRFRVRRQETLKRLDKVGANIELIDAQIDRMDRQLRQARQESSKATARLELQAEIHRLKHERDLVELSVIQREIRIFSDRAAEDGVAEIAWSDPNDSRAQREELRKRRADLAVRAEALRDRQSQWSHERSLEWNNFGRFLEELERGEKELGKERSKLAGAWSQGIGFSASLSTLLGGKEQAQVSRESAVEQVKIHLEQIEELRKIRGDAATENSGVSQALLKNLDLRNDLTGRMVQAQGNLASLQKEINRTMQRQQQIRAQTRQQVSAISVLLGELDEATRDAETTAAGLEISAHEAQIARNDFVALQQELQRVRLERESSRGRAEVLEHLERSREGLASGVRELFSLLDGPAPGPWNTVIGLAGEFLHVRREYAPLLDLLLGDKSQRVLVRDDRLLAQALADRKEPFPGRVSFLGPGSPHLETDSPSDWHEGEAIHPVPRGVVALAENLARCDLPGFLDLPQKLLGQALVVEDLSIAAKIRPDFAGYRLITLAGEILEPDGTLTIGQAASDSGIVSRKAELRELRERIVDAQAREKVLEKRLDAAQKALDLADERVETLEYQGDLLTDRLAVLHQKLQESELGVETLEREAQSLGGELRQAHEEMIQWSEVLADSQREGEALRAELTSLEERKDGAAKIESVTAQKLNQLEKQFGLWSEKLKAADLQLQSIESSLQSALTQRDKVIGEIGETLGRIGELERRAETTARLALHAGQAVARIETACQEIQRELVPIVLELADLDARWEIQEREREAVQEAFNLRREREHRLQMALQEKNIRLENLLKRTREEDNRDLLAEWEALEPERKDELAETPIGPVEKKLAEVKHKVAQLGPGDPWILSQLEQLEKDRAEIAHYREDLFGARAILVEILQRLDAECGRMFLATFEEIRGQFQELFRKLFGGGQADLILEKPGEPLDGSIDIQARPPGKEMRSLVLLSGGEKTMTVVALLLAIFRSRPSPFCLMDEVDAALDESNVGRFAGVLRQFCDRTQFLLITHSKKTMSVADTLMGITMQESGVSTRVAVRIEDWTQEAQIKKAA